jgi:hypothetical protein
MATIKIPESDMPILKQISELGTTQFNSLIAAIGGTKPTFSRGQFAEGVAKQVKVIKKPVILSIFRVAFVLYSMKERTGMSPEELADDIANSYFHTRSKENHFGSRRAKTLSGRLKKLLSFDKTIAITAKAFEVMTEQDHAYCRARILSDIRPVFTNSAQTASAAVVIHTLQIGFHHGGSGGKHKEFYVALDTNDVQALKAVIERAEEKTAALEKILHDSKVPYLKV